MTLSYTGQLDLAILIGLVALFVWYLLAHSTLLDRPMSRLRERFPLLIMCPWCSGFWITGLLLATTGHYDPLTHAAAATTVGVVGGFAT